MTPPKIASEFLTPKTGARAIVTGGAGFIGSRLIEALVARGTKVISIDNYSTGTTDRHVDSPNVSYHTWDTADGLEWLLPFEPNIVYHLGEYARIVTSFEDVRQVHRSNSAGSFNVFEFCRESKAKLVYSATSSALGNEGKDENLNPYAWMKSKNVELIKNYGEWYGMEHAIAYFFNVYGPGQITQGKYAAVIGIFQQCVLEGRPIPVVSPGVQSRDFTHVDDIVAGLLLVADQGSGDGYLLGTNQCHTMIEVAEMFDHPYELVPERPGERFTSTVLPSRARTELGWTAEKSLADYIGAWKAGLEVTA
ncbi:MAG: NAD-dependent epimerase/dehydratase family protein [Armatimonadetes bacterium]|nr:NAD-dependent epimerase/dehydratase family protein [Armatimonadota bacterium]